MMSCNSEKGNNKESEASNEDLSFYNEIDSMSSREKIYRLILEAPDSIYLLVRENLDSLTRERLCIKSNFSIEVSLTLVNYIVKDSEVNEYEFDGDSLISLTKGNKVMENLFIDKKLLYSEFKDIPSSTVNFRLESLKLCNRE